MHTTHYNIPADDLPTRKVDCALQMARHGFKVHPCVPGTKKPHLSGFQDGASRSNFFIQKWWLEDFPDAEIGIILDQNVIVLDVDKHDGHPDGYASLAALEKEHGPLPPTWTVQSGERGQGEHRYYGLPQPVRNLTGCVPVAPGIQVLGSRANVIAPGSRHQRGTTYRWVHAHDPGTIKMADAPQWLVDMAAAAAPQRKAGTTRQAQKPQKAVVCFAEQASIPGELGNTSLLPAAPPYTGAQIRSLFGDETVARRCLAACGLDADVPIGTNFHCHLHGPDNHPSAAILPPTEEHPTYLFVCFHRTADPEPAEPRGISLPELYYLSVTGHRSGTMPKASFLVWATRLLVKAGVLQPQPQQAPKLRPGAPAQAQTVYEGFLELLRVRSLLTTRHAPYAWKFALEWCYGVKEYALSKALRWLIAKGYMIKAGIESGIPLFKLGGSVLRRQLRDAPVSSSQTAALEAVEPAVERYGNAPAPLRRTGQGAEEDDEHSAACACAECAFLRDAQERLDELRRRNGYSPGFALVAAGGTS